MDATENTADERDAAARAEGIDPATGFATDGEWPVNGRLRAEAMAAAGVTSDPAGMIDDELIAATKDRIAAEEAQAKQDTPSMDWTVAKLRDYAASNNIPVETDANKATILAAIDAATAA